MNLLILDLDETLVYADKKPLLRAADYCVGDYHVYNRPGLDDFLKMCFDHFEVAVWTSSNREYAEQVVENSFPSPEKLVFFWDRESCTRRYHPETFEHYWIKNLKKVKRKGYSLDNVLMVDDTPSKLERNYGNHICVREWDGSEDDIELCLLTQYLKQFRNMDNVRRIKKRGWRSSASLMERG